MLRFQARGRKTDCHSDVLSRRAFQVVQSLFQNGTISKERPAKAVTDPRLGFLGEAVVGEGKDAQTRLNIFIWPILNRMKILTT